MTPSRQTTKMPRSSPVLTFSTSSSASKSTEYFVQLPLYLTTHLLFFSILKNPTEDKFRVLKKSNKTIQQKLLGLQPTGVVIQLIEAMGYTMLDDEIHAFAGDYFAVLMEGSKLVQNAIT